MGRVPFTGSRGKMRQLKLDTEITGRAKAAIAHGALTNSKRPESLVKGVYPTHIKMARGAKCWDTAGNQYLDFICGLGSTIIGHNNDSVAAAMQSQLRYGVLFSLGSDVEVLAAEKIKEIIPFGQKVRFLKTGTEASNAAIKIARAYTGRDLVLSDGYHGWSDDFVSLTPPAKGVPKRDFIKKLDTNNIDETVAAVIVEPIITDFSPERTQWLRDLRDRCTKTGALLIFDEIITGLRFPELTFSKHSGIYPDLILLGKAIANGMPLSVVAGKNEVMESDYFVSSTYAGECLSLRAMMATLHEIQTRPYQELWEHSHDFQTKFNNLAPETVRLDGYGTRGVFVADQLNKTLFLQEAVRSGILMGPSFFFGFQHIEYKEMVLNTLNEILVRIKTGNVKLQGELLQTPFAQKVREAK